MKYLLLVLLLTSCGEPRLAHTFENWCQCVSGSSYKEIKLLENNKFVYIACRNGQTSMATQNLDSLELLLRETMPTNCSERKK